MRVFLFLAVITISYLASAQKVELVVKTDISCSHCLECGSCSKLISEALFFNAKGISDVKVDPEAETITVTYNSNKTTPAEIRTTISKAGYDADDVPADASAYQALDGCCKKKD